eukprot:4703009-Pyramimonas_sp.AAC.1
MYVNSSEAFRVAQGGALGPTAADTRIALDSLAKVTSYFARQIEWVHVPGHAAHDWNEMVDTISTRVSPGTGDLPRPDDRWRESSHDQQTLQWMWLRFETLQ